ncbi:Kunitz-type serine protease inhibitor A like protein [Argiope bruennichi]|uniref:Kunitz-type serine protease inhibitor A like protein n=1 Tax=Argiope bruennichi TaxID=94029 RepID=A0A8T0DYD6_ARGBR|nr:Kunitz-type serine protease inhibitor A like protein [Argiope bruennichi]
MEGSGSEPKIRTYYSRSQISALYDSIQLKKMLQVGKGRKRGISRVAKPFSPDIFPTIPKCCAGHSGCYCKRGFVQARNGSCIRFSDCPRDTENTSLIRNCLDVPKDGNCRADIAMWYYDQESGFCRRFYYSGCDGNGNRYASEEECLQHCKGELFQKHECGENSHYNGCGTPSPVTCENYENPPDYRVMMCQTGCQCNEGYVQAEDGNCVLPDDCPGKNEILLKSDSIANEKSDLIIPRMVPFHQNTDKIQTLLSQNQMGKMDSCYTTHLKRDMKFLVGFMLLVVVVQARQLQECGENSQYDGCGNPCPITREYYENPPEYCTKNCNPGCHCDERWFYKQLTGTCHQFLCGGCQGNGNNYSTEEECSIVGQMKMNADPHRHDALVQREEIRINFVMS